MAEDDTLLAHLLPKYTSSLEDAATDAVAYILNKSDEAMDALNDLLQHGGFEIEPIKRVQTQVSYEDTSRPDMTGYDKDDVKRLLVESKFWAELLEGQASDYIKLLDQPGPAVLMFISPKVRIETLWAAIRRQMEESELEYVASPSGVYRAKLAGADRHLMLLSWLGLLDSMDAAVSDAAFRSDIAQVRGLARRQDAEAFLPIHPEDLSPDFGRRVVGYNRLVDDAVDARGVEGGWMDIRRARATPQRHGYGRYFSFFGVSGYFWFGINHEQWARSGDSPLWLLVGDDVQANMEEIGREMNSRPQDRWLPIRPKLNVEYVEVLNDVARQLRAVANVVGARRLESESPAG